MEITLRPSKANSNDVGTVCYFDSLHHCSPLLTYITESNVLVFTCKSDVAHPLPTEHSRFPGIERTDVLGLLGNITIIRAKALSEWSFSSCMEDVMCLNIYNTSYKVTEIP